MFCISWMFAILTYPFDSITCLWNGSKIVGPIDSTDLRHAAVYVARSEEQVPCSTGNVSSEWTPLIILITAVSCVPNYMSKISAISLLGRTWSSLLIMGIWSELEVNGVTFVVGLQWLGGSYWWKIDTPRYKPQSTNPIVSIHIVIFPTYNPEILVCFHLRGIVYVQPVPHFLIRTLFLLIRMIVIANNLAKFMYTCIDLWNSLDWWCSKSR